MSRLFNRAASDKLSYAGAVQSAAALTMACWFNTDNDTDHMCLMSEADNTVVDQAVALYARGDDANNKIWFQMIAGGAWPIASTSTGYTVNTWHHACGIWAGAADRRAFIDGGSKGTNNAICTPAGLNETAIGTFCRLGNISFFSGHICEAAIWNATLTDDEVAVLAAGYSPRFIRPESLLAYWPLIRTVKDIVGGCDMTATGTNVSDQVDKVIYPASAQPVPKATPVSSVISRGSPGSRLIRGIDRLRGLRRFAPY